MSRWVLLSLLVLAAAPVGSAAALAPSAHRDIAERECRDVGLPGSFCMAVASSAYSTDQREWDDLSAHAQIPEGSSTCDAANATAEREQRLGEDIRNELDQLTGFYARDPAERIASALGRALHTVQDECAHHGMPNPQHSWLSRSDFCEGTEQSPDLQPEAVACARTATRELLGDVRAALDARGVALAFLDAVGCEDIGAESGGGARTTPCRDQVLPSPFQACDFLAGARRWDGVDRRWDASVVGPGLLDAFARGLLDATRGSVRICDGDEVLLGSGETADVSAGPPSCTRMELLCLGKTDEAESFFDESPALSAPQSALVPSSSPASSSSCSSTSSSRGAPTSWLSLLALVALIVRRRRERHSRS